MNRSKMTTFAVICGLSAGLASAQDSGDIFKQLDKDNDGILVADEVSEEQRRFFDRLVRTGDKNEDGKLSQAEYNATLKADEQPQSDRPERGGRFGNRRPGGGPGQFGRGPEAMARLDRNGDGKIQKDEVPEQLRERMQPLFDRFMSDTIDLDRLRQYGRFGGNRPDEEARGRSSMRRDGDRPQREGNRPERDGERREGDRDSREARMQREGDRPQFSGRDGERPGFGRGPGGPGGGVAFVRVLDQDKNGRISKEEALHVAKLFEELDADKDGELDGRELMGFGGGRPGFMGRERDRPESSESRERGRPDGERPPSARGDSAGRGRGRTDAERSETDQARRGPGPGRQGFAGRGGFGPEFILQRFDQNDDGAISKEEAPEMMARGFDRIDSNSDGKLTAEEFSATMFRGGSRDGEDSERRRGFGRRGGDRPQRPAAEDQEDDDEEE